MKLPSLLFVLGLAPAMLLPRTAFGQVADSLASVSYEYLPKAEALHDPRSQISLGVLRFRAGLPIPLSKKTILIPGLSYELIDVHVHGTGTPAIADLHAPAANLTLVQMFGDRIMAIASVGAGFASDFRDRVSIDDVLLTATGIVGYKFSDDFTLGVGVGYDRRLGRFQPIPAVVLNWRITDRLRLRGFVPAAVNFEYRATPWLTTGLRGTLDGNTFHSGHQYGTDGLELAYSTLSVGPKLTFNLVGWTNLDVYAAAAVRRRYEIFVDGNSQNTTYLPPVVAFGARLWFGPSGWKSDPSAQPANEQH